MSTLPRTRSVDINIFCHSNGSHSDGCHSDGDGDDGIVSFDFFILGGVVNTTIQ